MHIIFLILCQIPFNLLKIVLLWIFVSILESTKKQGNIELLVGCNETTFSPKTLVLSDIGFLQC